MPLWLLVALQISVVPVSPVVPPPPPPLPSVDLSPVLNQIYVLELEQHKQNDQIAAILAQLAVVSAKVDAVQGDVTVLKTRGFDWKGAGMFVVKYVMPAVTAVLVTIKAKS